VSDSLELPTTKVASIRLAAFVYFGVQSAMHIRERQATAPTRQKASDAESQSHPMWQDNRQHERQQMMGIQVEDLHKRFGDNQAVQGLSFEVQRGEIYGLLGPNGAGKTTTLRVVAGLLAPTAGCVRVAGIDVATDPILARRHLGFFTGSAGLYARLTARELLTHTAELFDVLQPKARLKALSQELDLEAFWDRRCEVLSTGQKQRVSLARALVHDPPALILDEPTSGLDVLASQSFRQIVSAARDEGKAIILCTHYMAEAELLCDRVGLMHAGRLIAEGTPQDLRAETGAQTLEETFLWRVAPETRASKSDSKTRPTSHSEGSL